MYMRRNDEPTGDRNVLKWTLIASRWPPQTTGINLGNPLAFFASTYAWFVTINYWKHQVCNYRILLNYKSLISSSYSTAGQNGTRQTDESWCLRRFSIQFS
jgi:hypothetical protein